MAYSEDCRFLLEMGELRVSGTIWDARLELGLASTKGKLGTGQCPFVLSTATVRDGSCLYAVDNVLSFLLLIRHG